MGSTSSETAPLPSQTGGPSGRRDKTALLASVPSSALLPSPDPLPELRYLGACRRCPGNQALVLGPCSLQILGVGAWNKMDVVTRDEIFSLGGQDCIPSLKLQQSFLKG